MHSGWELTDLCFPMRSPFSDTIELTASSMSLMRAAISRIIAKNLVRSAIWSGTFDKIVCAQKRNEDEHLVGEAGGAGQVTDLESLCLLRKIL